MAESVLAYFLLAGALWYGFARVAMAALREQEERRRAGELAWQEWERR